MPPLLPGRLGRGFKAPDSESSRGGNWNAAMTAPVPVRDLYLAKLILDVGVSALAQLCIGALFLLSGLLAAASAGSADRGEGRIFVYTLVYIMQKQTVGKFT